MDSRCAPSTGEELRELCAAALADARATQQRNWVLTQELRETVRQVRAARAVRAARLLPPDQTGLPT